MSTNTKLLLVWILAAVIILICALWMPKGITGHIRSQYEARKVESFPDHSEIPNTQNFEEHVESRLNSEEDPSN